MEDVYGWSGVRMYARDTYRRYLFSNFYYRNRRNKCDWSDQVPFIKMGDQGDVVLDQDIDLVITTITGIVVTTLRLFLFATGFWINHLFMVSATYAEENRNGFEHAFAVMPMQGKPYLREQDNGSKCI